MLGTKLRTSTRITSTFAAEPCLQVPRCGITQQFYKTLQVKETGSENTRDVSKIFLILNVNPKIKGLIYKKRRPC